MDINNTRCPSCGTAGLHYCMGKPTDSHGTFTKAVEASNSNPITPEDIKRVANIINSGVAGVAVHVDYIANAKQLTKMNAKIAALTAERDRLREALNGLVCLIRTNTEMGAIPSIFSEDSRYLLALQQVETKEGE